MRVLVTGGSSGIGLAIAKACIARGYEVTITGRDAKKLIDTKMEFHIWDHRDISCVESHLDVIGDIDILINNAGQLTQDRFPDVSEECWDNIQGAHVKGAFFLTQEVVKRWVANGTKGRILNITSVRSVLGVEDGPYGMAKWAMRGLTAGLALKLASHGIQVNAIAPGLIDTPGLRAKWPGCNAKCVPLGRLGTPEEIADIALFILSCDLITGQTIVCDGGWSLKC